MARNINNLDSLLLNIYENTVRIREDEFAQHYEVFHRVFNKLHESMKEVDKYYARYTSKVQTMGSHYDRLRIVKPDEFDIFNVIRLPAQVEKRIVVRPEQASFVFLELDDNCKRELEKSPNWEVDKQVLEWLDNNGRIQRSKFFDWFKGVVEKALGNNNHFAYSSWNPDAYTIKRSETGPAVTLIIKNNRGFNMSVDLVPSLRFPPELWPSNYRPIPHNYDWMVVTKPDKYREEAIRKIQWRIVLPEQERDLMNDSKKLRVAMKLMKKLRDTQGMAKLVSYFLKQLVFWKIEQERHGASFYKESVATLFKVMVKWLYDAVKEGRIPYYWHSKNNLLQRVDVNTLKVYENTLLGLIKVLGNPNDFKKVAQYLLTSEEQRKFNV